MLKDAHISPDGRYRYWLAREWDTLRRQPVLFIMLNPSTADASQDDPTIRKCIGFAKAWGYGRIEVVNLYAFRATDPKALKASGYDVGPNNNMQILHYARWSGLVVAAWGAHAQKDRADAVVKMLAPHHDIQCLGLTKDGFPRHPLMVAYKQPLVLFEGQPADSSLVVPRRLRSFR